MGGCSSEREISLKSGKAVFHALQEAGCDVTAIELNTMAAKEILSQLRQAQVDVVFLVLHGPFGEDGTIQSILEKEKILYTGSGPQASRLAMDKAETQTLLKQNGILVPEFRILTESQMEKAAAILQSLGGCPVVVKPSCEGSSIGITIVNSEKDFTPALKTAFALGPQVIVEQYIIGREITSGILGREALPLVEIRTKHPFFDFTAKYQKGMSEYIVPAPIDPAVTRRIQEMSLKAFDLIGCRDMGRADFILDQEGDQQGKAYFLEMNTIPGFTATSLLPMAAQNQGMNFTELCLKITGYAVTRRNGGQRKAKSGERIAWSG